MAALRGFEECGAGTYAGGRSRGNTGRTAEFDFGDKSLMLWEYLKSRVVSGSSLKLLDPTTDRR